MGAAGEFWDDALEGGVFFVLGVENVGEDFARGNIYDGGGGFIAGGFECEDEHEVYVSERFHDRQSHDKDKEEGGDFVVEAKKAAGAGVGALAEVAGHDFEGAVEAEEEDNEGEFGMEPALLHDFRVLGDEGKAKGEGGGRGGAHDELGQFGFHEREGGSGFGVLDMVHEQAGKVEKAREPRGEADDVEGFEEKIRVHGGQTTICGVAGHEDSD